MLSWIIPFHTGTPCLCQGHKRVEEPRYLYPSPVQPLAQRDLSVKQKTFICILYGKVCNGTKHTIPSMEMHGNYLLYINCALQI